MRKLLIAVAILAAVAAAGAYVGVPIYAESQARTQIEGFLAQLPEGVSGEYQDLDYDYWGDRINLGRVAFENTGDGPWQTVTVSNLQIEGVDTAARPGREPAFQAARWTHLSASFAGGNMHLDSAEGSLDRAILPALAPGPGGTNSFDFSTVWKRISLAGATLNEVKLDHPPADTVVRYDRVQLGTVDSGHASSLEMTGIAADIAYRGDLIRTTAARYLVSDFDLAILDSTGFATSSSTALAAAFRGFAAADYAMGQARIEEVQVILPSGMAIEPGIGDEVSLPAEVTVTIDRGVVEGVRGLRTERVTLSGYRIDSEAGKSGSVDSLVLENLNMSSLPALYEAEAKGPEAMNAAAVELMTGFESLTVRGLELNDGDRQVVMALARISEIQADKGIPTGLRLEVGGFNPGIDAIQRRVPIDLRAALQQDEIVLDLTFDYSLDLQEGLVELSELTVGAQKLARLSLAAAIEHPELRRIIERAADGDVMTQPPPTSGEFVSAELVIDDETLVARAVELAAAREGVDPATLRRQYLALLGHAAISLESARLRAAAEALESFLRDPGRLRILMQPNGAVPIDEIIALARHQPQELAERLRLEIVATPRP